jgi:uncharacterized protein YcbX
VKSLALIDADTVQVGVHGISEDRRFLVRSREGVLVTQRQIGKLALVRADYCAASDTLRLEFPDETSLSGSPELGDKLETKVFRRTVSGNAVKGGWSEALSEFCGAELTLVKSDSEGEGFDEYPVSLLSQASIEHLGNMAQNGSKVEYRRFRPNLLLDGCDAHEEDTWLGKEVMIGSDLRLRVEKLDPRCAITTLNPDTGERDLDTPRLILGYRSEVSGTGACFGIYAAVVTPGAVSVGDEVRVAA